MIPRNAAMALGAAALLACWPAAVPDLAAQTRTTRVLALEGAKKAAAAAEQLARGRGWVVSIAIVDAGGSLLHFVRMDGASSASVDLSLGKARTSARFRRPTKAFADGLAAGRMGLLSVEGLLAMEGAVPVTVEGEVVAAIGVSGMTGEQDAEIATAGAAAVQ